MDLQGDSSLYIKERWEKESGITISTEDESFLCAFIVIVLAWTLLFFNIENVFLDLYLYSYRP